MSYENFNDTRNYNGRASFVPPVMLPGDTSLTASGGARDAMPGGGYGRSSAQQRGAVTEPQRYGSVTVLMTTLVLNVNTVLLLQPDTTRVFLAIQNLDATTDLWVNFGKAATVNNGLRLVAGATVWYDAFVSQDDINALSAASILVGLSYANMAF